METEQYNKNTGNGEHANHPKYNKTVGEQLKQFAKENPGRTQNESLKLVRNLSKSLKDLISKNPNTKINNLFKSIVVAPDNIKNTTPKKIEPIKKPKQ